MRERTVFPGLFICGFSLAVGAPPGRESGFGVREFIASIHVRHFRQQGKAPETDKKFMCLWDTPDGYESWRDKGKAGGGGMRIRGGSGTGGGRDAGAGGENKRHRRMTAVANDAPRRLRRGALECGFPWIRHEASTNSSRQNGLAWSDSGIRCSPAASSASSALRLSASPQCRARSCIRLNRSSVSDCS